LLFGVSPLDAVVFIDLVVPGHSGAAGLLAACVAGDKRLIRSSHCGTS